MRVTIEPIMRITNLVAIFFGIFILTGSDVLSQDKPWTDWSKKDAEKILNSSGWGQTFTVEPSDPINTAAVTNTRGGFSGERRGESGDAPASKSVHYRARLLSAKPIREAFSRIVVLQQPEAAGLKDQLQGFVDRDFGDYLVVAFSIESEDARMMKGSEMMLAKLTAETLKEKVYLERKDGKRAQFLDYKPPVGDGMGGKIVFSKTLDGQPFLRDEDDTARLFVQLSEKQKLTFRFKVSSMNHRGKLEY
jgi:hypothetical protein